MHVVWHRLAFDQQYLFWQEVSRFRILELARLERMLLFLETFEIKFSQALFTFVAITLYQLGIFAIAVAERYGIIEGSILTDI